MAASHCFQAVGPGTGLGRSASGFSSRVVAPTLPWYRYAAMLIFFAFRPDRTWSATPMTISAQKVIPTTKRTTDHIFPAPSLTRSPYGSSIGRCFSGSIERLSIDGAVGKSVLLSSALSSVSVRMLPARECWRLCPRVAPELPRKTQRPGLVDRVVSCRSWLSEAERGGFEPPVSQDRSQGR
jgi:hypothetical protein